MRPRAMCAAETASGEAASRLKHSARDHKNCIGVNVGIAPIPFGSRMGIDIRQAIATASQTRRTLVRMKTKR